MQAQVVHVKEAKLTADVTSTSGLIIIIKVGAIVDKKLDWIFNIWIVGLSESVEGAILKFLTFHQNLEFSNFQPHFPSERSYMDFTVHVCKQKVHILAVRTLYFWKRSTYGPWRP